MEIKDKIKLLEDYLKDKKCILGFSAGSDSTLLAFILSRVSSDSLLVTVDNNMMPNGFIEYTVTKSKEFNLKHEIIKLNFIEDPEFISNNHKRCYNCRNLMYKNIRELPEFKEYDLFIEGTNLTDLLEDRPGVLILDKYDMISPLVECGITKDDVFNILDYYNINYSFNTTCLSTRVKTNESINKEKLSMVDTAEHILRKYVQQNNMRVRFDNYQAIISIDSPDELMNSEKLNKINKEFLELGFKRVFLDITGYTQTKFKYKTENDYFYYQLPYTIDINKTVDKINKKTKLEITKEKNEITYKDITIQKNGKIIISRKNNFYKKFNEILPYIKREI